MKYLFAKYININQIINLQFVLSLLFGFLIIIFPFIFHPLDWEDYSITFNGTWLMYKGYAPYSDFGIPTGIGSFIFPYLSFVLFGANYNSLYIMQAIEHGILVYSCYLLYGTFIKSVPNKKLAVSITVFILSLFVIFNVKAQFYNSEFLLFELFSFVFVMRAINSKTKNGGIIRSFFAALFVFLTLQVKQDYGVINLLIILTVLIIHKFKNKESIQLITYLISLICLVGLFLLLVDFNRFIYWFNFGQNTGGNANLWLKLKSCFEKREAISLLLLIGINAILFKVLCTKVTIEEKKFYSFPFIIFCGFGFQNILTLSSSNFPYLYYAVAFLVSSILLQLFLLLKFNFRALFLVNLLLIIFLYFNLNQVYKSIYYFHPNGLIGTRELTEKSRFSAMGISRNYKSNGADFQFCKDIIDSIYRVKKEPLCIANFTSMPFEMEVPTRRIKGLPLWPDNNVLLFKKEQQLYLNLLEKGEFDLIFILELDFKGSQFTNHEFKNKALENYRLLTSFLLLKYKGERRLLTMIKKS
ncbi:MAG: hypothetical protein PSX81_13425 [bacterium]|nr:hypothetical protein [bacterium]